MVREVQQSGHVRLRETPTERELARERALSILRFSRAEDFLPLHHLPVKCHALRGNRNLPSKLCAPGRIGGFRRTKAVDFHDTTSTFKKNQFIRFLSESSESFFKTEQNVVVLKCVTFSNAKRSGTILYHWFISEIRARDPPLKDGFAVPGLRWVLRAHLSHRRISRQGSQKFATTLRTELQVDLKARSLCSFR